MRRNPLMIAGVPCLLIMLAAKIGFTDSVNAEQADTPRTQHSTGWLGIALSCTGCDQGAGTGPLIVRAITSGGPAERILTVGDTIVAVNGSITEPQRMREALLATPRDSLISFVMHGARGRYTVALRKHADRMMRVGNVSLPLKYQGAFAGVGVEVLTGAAPVISRDTSGAMVIRVGEHVVRLNLPPETVK